MQKFNIWAACAVILLAVTGCGGDPEEKLLNDAMATMKEIVSTLETVKDKASAQAAKPKLEALFKKLQETGEAGKKAATDKAKSDALEKKYAAQLKDLQEKMSKEIMRIATNPETVEVMEALKGMQKP